MTDFQEPSLSPARQKHFLIRAIVLGLLGAGLIGFLAWLSVKEVPPSLTSSQGGLTPQAQTQKGESAAPAGSPDALAKPTSAADTLKSQLEQVMIGIREANQKKDLSQLLSYYSPNFPQLTQRAQRIAKTWNIFNYAKMEFEITEIKLLSENNAIANVSWDVEAQNISTLKTTKYSKIYVTGFIRESGQWRIKALDLLE
jgi:hypothetical protein